MPLSTSILHILQYEALANALELPIYSFNAVIVSHLFSVRKHLRRRLTTIFNSRCKPHVYWVSASGKSNKRQYLVNYVVLFYEESLLNLSLVPFIQPVGEDAQRLFHGRGHRWPGLEHINIDWYRPLALITLYAEEEIQQLRGLAALLVEQVGALQVVVQYRCRAGAPFECLHGDMPQQMVIHEHQLAYQLHLNRSQNTGLFLDMANGRRWVQEHAKGRNVLNLFAYTCGFSVAAIAGGATKVVNIDMSKGALSHGRENHRLNGQDVSRVIFEGVNLFKSWGRVKKFGPYDLLVCDPPTFQKGSVDIRRDYAKILRRLPEYMNPGANLLLCLNAPDLGEDFLLDQVAEHAPQCRFVERVANPEVFAEAQQGRGLKVLHFRFDG